MSDQTSRLSRSPTRLFILIGLFVAASAANCMTMPNGNDNDNDNDNVGDPPIILTTDHILAEGTPALTVVEYADFQCPFCGRFARETYPTIKAEYIDTGKVRWVFRHFPLAIHANARDAAEASECAHDQGMFWEYHDHLFNNQAALDVASLKAYAGQLGLDQTTFDGCLDGGGKAARVQMDVDSGTALGVTGTPAFFIGGRRVQGFQTISQFRALLDDALD
jgi:protein-disulfide isomerase